MKISEIVMMDNFNTGEVEEVEFGTREVRDESWFSKDNKIVRKIFIDNSWFLIAMLVLTVAIGILTGFAYFVVKDFEFFILLLFCLNVVFASVTNMGTISSYLLNKNLEDGELPCKPVLSKWFWFKARIIEDYGEPNEFKQKVEDFLNKASAEVSRKALVFYWSHIVVVNISLLVVTIAVINNKPDKIALAVFEILLIAVNLYLFFVRKYILKRADLEFDFDIKFCFDEDGEDELLENFSAEARFSLNGNYKIEEDFHLNEKLTMSELQKCLEEFDYGYLLAF